MKKRLVALTLTCALAATALAGCGGSTGGDSTASGDSTAATETSGAEGSVYYLNFKPEQDQQWQDLAKAYTEETGVPVTVVTAASGNYETTLMSGGISPKNIYCDYQSGKDFKRPEYRKLIRKLKEG